MKTPSKKSKGHKAGISRWWSFRRKKHLNFLHLCWEVHLLQQENGCKLWRNLRQISPLPLQLYVFCKFFYHNGVRFFMKPYWIFHAQNFHNDVSYHRNQQKTASRPKKLAKYVVHTYVCKKSIATFGTFCKDLAPLWSRSFLLILSWDFLYSTTNCQERKLLGTFQAYWSKYLLLCHILLWGYIANFFLSWPW